MMTDVLNLTDAIKVRTFIPWTITPLPEVLSQTSTSSSQVVRKTVNFAWKNIIPNPHNYPPQLSPTIIAHHPGQLIRHP